MTIANCKLQIDGKKNRDGSEWRCCAARVSFVIWRCSLVLMLLLIPVCRAGAAEPSAELPLELRPYRVNCSSDSMLHSNRSPPGPTFSKRFDARPIVASGRIGRWTLPRRIGCNRSPPKGCRD